MTQSSGWKKSFLTAHMIDHDGGMLLPWFITLNWKPFFLIAGDTLHLGPINDQLEAAGKTVRRV